jgi:hypothetical protein
VTEFLTEKQKQYNAAMEKYDKKPVYVRFGLVVSFINIGCQVLFGLLAFRQSIGAFRQVLVFAAAYILADFINGLVHMYMDNADDYEAPYGPLIAAFHLHHRTPAYKIKPMPAVYWHESGSKIWLAIFQVTAVAAVWFGAVSGAAVWGIFYFSVLSCVAEVSHYLCHVPNTNAFERLLGRTGVLMNNRYHAKEHHSKDNLNYAFLNAMTDPLIDLIAFRLYPGYKSTTDTHYAFYTGAGTENRN